MCVMPSASTTRPGFGGPRDSTCMKGFLCSHLLLRCALVIPQTPYMSSLECKNLYTYLVRIATSGAIAPQQVSRPTRAPR